MTIGGRHNDKIYRRENIYTGSGTGAFKSVGWISAEYPQRLHKALMNSQTVLTAWDGG